MNKNVIMEKGNKYSIKVVEKKDFENLIVFFKKAYGVQTVFQNIRFLKHYFSSREKFPVPRYASLIAIDSRGKVVSHYGGLFYELRIGSNIHTLIWGVNAYTLPEWRGKGINSLIVNYVLENSEIHGVIGFTEKTASFYEKTGYNIFNFQRFTRYISILDRIKTAEAVAFIKQDLDRFCVLTETQPANELIPETGCSVELTFNNIDFYELDFDEGNNGIVTTHRTKEFLKWRILGNPFIKYRVFGFTKNRKLLTYIVLREETLSPLGFKVSRIIDLFGRKEGIIDLLNRAIRESILNEDIYVDFSMFGVIYGEELALSSFVKLENNDCCLLPQVTTPVENRLNYEYIGLFSKIHSKAIADITKENVYFTRIDSDRDRFSRISQTDKI